MGPPLKAAENKHLEKILAEQDRASMGPPLKAAENFIQRGRGSKRVEKLQWGRR